MAQSREKQVVEQRARAVRLGCNVQEPLSLASDAIQPPDAPSDVTPLDNPPEALEDDVNRDPVRLKCPLP